MTEQHTIPALPAPTIHSSELSKPAVAPSLRPRRNPNDNTVYIGKKSVMNYVIAVVTQFNNGALAVRAKARGASIGRLVDVTQIVKNRFVATLKVADVNLSTEELKSEDGRMTKVSSMEVTMTK